MNTTNHIVHVLIADAHPVTRAGIRAILEQELDIEAVGETGSSADVPQLIAKLSPEVLLLDPLAFDGRWYEAENWICANGWETAVLVLTTHEQDCYLAQTVEVGGVGYLTKDESPARLVQAIHCAAQGEVLITREQLARANRWRAEVGERWKRLTNRERQALQLLMQGLDNAAIGEELDMAVKTVAYHITKLLRKLGVTSRLQAAAWGHTYLPDGLRGSLQDRPSR
jgi:two-component system response regulator DevR